MEQDYTYDTATTNVWSSSNTWISPSELIWGDLAIANASVGMTTADLTSSLERLVVTEVDTQRSNFEIETLKAELSQLKSQYNELCGLLMQYKLEQDLAIVDNTSELIKYHVAKAYVSLAENDNKAYRELDGFINSFESR